MSSGAEAPTHDPSAPGQRSRLRRWYLSLAVALAAAPVPAPADPQSMEHQLERMSTALRSLSYEGTLVYVHGSRLETMRIVRRVENGQVHEVLESLNGPVRVVEREEDRVICRLSDDRPIAVHGQGLDAELLRPKAVDLDKLAPNYVVHPLGEARVAGRQTDVVGIIPRDQLRYGYRFYVDAESGLPLKSDLMGGEAKPIEQIIFTSLTLLPGQTPRPATQAATAPEVSPAAPVRGDTGPWRFAGMPPGFHLVLVDRPAGAAEDSTEHYVVSDGLASVSIYIERGVEDGLQGGSRIGAVHAVGGRIAGHQVTVVGEVPAATVEQVLAGIERREPVTE